jgi:hypothetical protein
MSRTRYHPLAVRELAKAAKRCDRDRPGSGAGLLDEVNVTAGRIAEAPREGSPYLYGTRRFVLQRFPFSAVYLMLVQGYIVAIAHHKRKPGYWRRRLRDIH